MWVQPYATFCSVFQFLFHEVNEIINGDCVHHHFLQDILQPPGMLLSSHQLEAYRGLVSWSLLCLPTEPLASVSLYAEINTASLAVNCICCMQVMHMQNSCFDQLSARSQHVVRRVSFRTSYFFLFLPWLVYHRRSNQLRKNPPPPPPSDDLSTCLSLLVLGVASSCLVSLAI